LLCFVVLVVEHFDVVYVFGHLRGPLCIFKVKGKK